MWSITIQLLMTGVNNGVVKTNKQTNPDTLIDKFWLESGPCHLLCGLGKVT